MLQRKNIVLLIALITVIGAMPTAAFAQSTAETNQSDLLTDSQLQPDAESIQSTNVTTTASPPDPGQWSVIATDPAGDASNDIRRLSAQDGSGTVYFRLEYENTWRDGSSYIRQNLILVDTDQDDSTGSGSNGAEYVIQPANNAVYSYSSGSFRQTDSLDYTDIQDNTDTFNVGVDLAKLGNPSEMDIMAIDDTEAIPDQGAGEASYTVGSSSGGSSGNFVDVTGVDGSNFTTVESYVTVDTQAGRQGQLTTNDFSVEENGQSQPVTDVEYVRSGNQTSATATDIVFVIDASGSMSDEIRTVRQEAKDMSQRLDSGGRDVRFGLVTFSDDNIPVEQPFTRDVTKLEQSLDNINTGGVDEYNYDALDKAMEMNFRSSAQKVVIDITDEGADLRSSSPTQQDTAQELQSRGINYIAVSKDYGQHSTSTTNAGTVVEEEESASGGVRPAKYNPDPDEDKAVLADRTGGQWYNIDRPDFSNVLSNITTSLNSTYIVEHDSTIPRSDALNRTVSVEVDDPNAGISSDTGSYSLPKDFVDVTGVDGSNFTTVESYVTVDTQAGRQGQLTANDFSVEENGQSQPINSVDFVRSNGTSPTATDIVFVIDATGSMQNEIDTVRREAKNLSRSLERGGRDVRFGLVTFTNDRVGVNQSLTRNVSDLEQSLDSIVASGGREYNYEALDSAMGMNFRSSAQKVMIDITDEDANLRSGGETQQDVAREIQQRGINYVAVSPNFGQGAASSVSTTSVPVTDESGVEITNAQNDLDKAVLASETGGEWYDIGQPDFSNILGNITTSLNSTYIVEHDSTIPRSDATNRTVTVTVDDPSAGIGSDTGTYSPAKDFVDVTGVDGSNFTTVESYVTVDTEAGRQGQLTATDFTVAENGQSQPISSVDFVQSNNGTSATATDIVFVIDATGSMQDEIDTVRREAKNLSRSLERGGRDVRFGLVTFSNDRVGINQTLTRNVTALEKSLDSIQASGGREYNYEAMDSAMGMNLRPSAQKVMIDITDENADLRTGGKTQQDVAREIKQRGINYVAVSPDFGQGAASSVSTNSGPVTDESGVKISTTREELDKAVLASETSGEWYDIGQPDFSNILGNITTSLNSTYIVEHDSTIPRSDATNRTVTVEVDDPSAGIGSDTGSYAVTAQNQSVSFEPAQQTISSGEMTTYELVIDNAPQGVDSYAYTVSSSDVNNATITDFQFAGSPSNTVLNYASDNSSVDVVGGFAGIPAGSDITIGTVTVSGDSAGSASISANINQLVNSNNNNIAIDSVAVGSLQIVDGSVQTLELSPPQQAVASGGTATFDLVVPNASAGVSSYDYTVSSSDVNNATITDFQPGGAPSSQTLSVKYASDNSSVDVFAGLAQVSPGSDVVIGTVTVSGVSDGSATISANVDQLIDGNNDIIGVSGVNGGTIQIGTGTGPGDITGDGNPATDPDGDGLYEDVNGDGVANLQDLRPFFNYIRTGSSTPAFDFSNDGNMNLQDLRPFFDDITPN